MTAFGLVRRIAADLTVPFIESPQTEAVLILCHILQWDSRNYILHKDDTVSQDIADKAYSLTRQRLTGRSLAAIFGSQPFCEAVFSVSDDVLIPRPETELLVEHILTSRNDSSANVLEIGVGSGIITISLAIHRPNWTFTAIDISEPAIRIAQQNAQTILGAKHNCAISIIQQDFFHYDTDQTFDIIVSNPPYIPAAETTRLLESRTISDPRIALDGGQDGLDFYRTIVSFGREHLRDSGIIAVEHGFDQRCAISEIAANAGYECQCRKDYAGLDRYTEMKKRI